MKPAVMAWMVALTGMSGAPAHAQTADAVLGLQGAAPLAEAWPQARIVVDFPLMESQSSTAANGMTACRADDGSDRAGAGDGAPAASPLIRCLYIVPDEALWRWVDAGGEPIALIGLPPGRRTVQITLANTDRAPLAEATVTFAAGPADPH